MAKIRDASDLFSVFLKFAKNPCFWSFHKYLEYD